jgi:hypothetical protein
MFSPKKIVILHKNKATKKQKNINRIFNPCNKFGLTHLKWRKELKMLVNNQESSLFVSNKNNK